MSFVNRIVETDKLNILEYEYMYNGAGVGIADFDNDGLQDILFTGNTVPSALFLNSGDLVFKQASERSGFITNSWCNGVSIVDINEDGKPDIYVSSAHYTLLNKTTNHFFINVTTSKGSPRFMDKAVDMNVADSSYTVQSAWLDYDKDGDLDLFLAVNSEESYPKNNPIGQRKNGRGNSTDKLYENKGIGADGLPHFEDISENAGILIEGWSLGVMVLDINTDGYPDIYVANDFMSNDILYINNGDGTFSNQIDQYFKYQSHNSMGMDVADINGDSQLDIVVLDMLPEDNLRKKTMFSMAPRERFFSSISVGYQPQFVKNVLQVSNANKQYNELGHYAGFSATDWSWSPLIADYDNDGLRDLYITNGYYRDITDMDFIDFNREARAMTSEKEIKKVLKKQLSEMEGVYKSNFFFKNTGRDVSFSDTTEESGLSVPSYSNGAAYADLDNDGDLELVVNNINEPVLLFKNQCRELDSTNNNFLRVKMPLNAKHLGTKLWVYTNGTAHYAEYYPQRGYLSSMEPVLHFGLGKSKMVDSLKIWWPNDLEEKRYAIMPNQVLTLENTGAGKPIPLKPLAQKTLLMEPMPVPMGIDFKNKENLFDDFKKWPLRYRSHSKSGPVLAVGDIDANGLNDVFIGGSATQDGQLFYQYPNKGFVPVVLDGENQKDHEDGGAHFFDADNDGDLDLYRAYSSSEHYFDKKRYQDELFINEDGVLTADSNALPNIDVPTETIISLDIDGDNDQDLFVGGRLDPNNYPFSPRSYLLINENGRFTDQTASLAPDLLYPGMVTGAALIDVNKDSKDDLILVGEYMEVSVYINSDGRFVKDDTKNGLKNTSGWYNCIKSCDFDKDGDLDLVVGNWGWNNIINPTTNFPIRTYSKDFDANGTVESIITYGENGKEFIYHPLGTLSSVFPVVRRSINSYRKYGQATFKEVFGAWSFEKNEVFSANSFASIFIENLGDGTFEVHQLPAEAQRAPIMDMEIVDINHDGFMDIVAVGNFTDIDLLSGYSNALDGVCLLNDMQRTEKFRALSPDESGLSIRSEVRELEQIKLSDGQQVLLLGVLNDSLAAYRLSQ
ncbi:MAG: VCBS repeat-containing protein [Bacteroidota bacterium]